MVNGRRACKTSILSLDGAERLIVDLEFQNQMCRASSHSIKGRGGGSVQSLLDRWAVFFCGPSVAQSGRASVGGAEAWPGDAVGVYEVVGAIQPIRRTVTGVSTVQNGLRL